MKLVCAIFTLYQNVFCYLFQASEKGKSDNDNDFKYIEPPIVAQQFQIVLKKQNEIFEIRIFSHSLNFFHFYLIYFYTHGISFLENTPCSGMLKKAFEKCKPSSLFSRFCGTLLESLYGFNQALVLRNFYLKSCNPIQICSWIFSKHFQNNFFIRELWTAAIIYKILRNSRLQKRCSKKFRKVHRKIPVQSLFFNKVAP